MTAESAQPRNVTRPFPVLWVGSGDETTASPALSSLSLSLSLLTCGRWSLSDSVKVFGLL